MQTFEQNYPESGALEKSAYYYWYLYMQTLDDYGPAHPLWADFGDVSVDFWDWWLDHENMFWPGEKMGVWELTSDDEIEQARNEGAYIVRIDPDCTRDYLLFFFNDFLNEKNIRRNKVGRRSHKEEMKMARYPLHQRPDAQSLKISLEAWKLRQQQPRPTLYQIGCDLNLCPDQVIRKRDTPAQRSDKQNVMNATVSRYLRWAENIRRNVALGIFPKNK